MYRDEFLNKEKELQRKKERKRKSGETREVERAFANSDHMEDHKGATTSTTPAIRQMDITDWNLCPAGCQ